MAEERFDLVVIGSGPGGYVAALRAVQLGLRTALIERGDWGGVCLNWGCIPTKALLRSAHLIADVRAAQSLGVQARLEAADFGPAMRRSRRVAEALAKGVRFLLERGGVAMIPGQGRLAGRAGEALRVLVSPAGAAEGGPGTAGTGTQGAARELLAPRVVLATGAHARELPGLAFDGRTILSSKEALALEQAPKRLLIVGAGAIGVEFADIFSTFGSEVTVVEMLPHLLPGTDRECASELARAFARRRIRVHCGMVVEAVEQRAAGLHCRLARAAVRPAEAAQAPPAPPGSGGPRSPASGDPEPVVVDSILVAAGVAPNRAGLGLESVGLGGGAGFVGVDDHLRTGVAGIYAIGDLIGPPLLAHAASAEGTHAVEHAAAGTAEPIDNEWIPGVVYTEPELASTGLTEEAARQAHGEIRVGRFPFRASGRALAEGRTHGLVKVLLDSGGTRLLGAHIAGPGAGELIAELALIGRCRIPIAQALATVHAHPTLMEAIPEALGAALGVAIHI